MSTDTPQSTPSPPPLLPGQTVMRIREDRRLTASWLLAFFLPVLVGVGFWFGWPLYQKQRALKQALAYTGIKLEGGVRAQVERVRIEDVGALPESLRRAAEDGRPWRVTLTKVKLRWQVGEKEYENPEPQTLLVFLDVSGRLLKITLAEAAGLAQDQYFNLNLFARFSRMEPAAPSPSAKSFVEVLRSIRAGSARPAENVWAFCFSAVYGPSSPPRLTWIICLDTGVVPWPGMSPNATEVVGLSLSYWAIVDAETGETLFDFSPWSMNLPPWPWPTGPAPLP